MSKRQSAGGGCRSVEIKRSYPCVKCKQLNKKCECAKFRNVYRNMYGPTTDETILVGMETLHNLVSSRCSESRSSVKAVNGTVYQPREYPAENGPPHNHKRDNNGGRGRDREMDNKPNKYRDYPSGSDEANIELLELDKNQSESRKRDDDKARRDNRKTKGNDNGRNGYKKGRGYEENMENARREVVSFNKAVCGDDDTPSVYSDIITADEAKSKEIISADHDMGDRSKSEQKFASRNLQSRETRYAIARITKYDEFTTYEILKSTRAKPRIIPQTTEGVFTVRNRKKRKLKL